TEPNKSESATAEPPPGTTLTDWEELEKAQKIAANAISASYKSYSTPKLSNQVDKHGRQMIAYPCKICGTKINHPTGDSSCSNLIKHAANCLRKQNKKSTVKPPSGTHKPVLHKPSKDS
ncbi:hypothetical protein PTTG_10612, partial [Puccinia triticina 1-1 BBBD Race 1]